MAAVAHRASAAANEAAPTTSLTITIPASVATGDALFVALTSRDHTSGTAYPTVTDNDAGGNTWTRIGESSNRKATLWYKIATSATASKTITCAGCVGSCTAGVSAYSGTATVPYSNLTVEDNASGNETHATFTPDHAGSFICLAVFNTANDNAIASEACTDPGTLTERYEKLSTGGSDCGNAFASALQAAGPTATGAINWTQTDGVTVSMAWAVPPPTVAMAGQLRTLTRAAGIALAMMYHSTPVRDATPMRGLGAPLTFAQAGLVGKGRATSPRAPGATFTQKLALSGTFRTGTIRGTGAPGITQHLTLAGKQRALSLRAKGASLTGKLALAGKGRATGLTTRAVLHIPGVSAPLAGTFRAAWPRDTAQRFFSGLKAGTGRYGWPRTKGTTLSITTQQVALHGTFRHLGLRPIAEFSLVFDLAEFRTGFTVGQNAEFSVTQPIQGTMRGTSPIGSAVLGLISAGSTPLAGKLYTPPPRLPGATLGLRTALAGVDRRLPGRAWVLPFTTKIPLVSTLRVTPSRLSATLHLTAPGVISLHGTQRSWTRLVSGLPTYRTAIQGTGRAAWPRLLQASRSIELVIVDESGQYYLVADESGSAYLVTIV